MAPKRRELVLAGAGLGKRLRVAVPGGAAAAAAAAAGGPPPASPGTRLLRRTVLVVLFLLRMSERVMVVESISQIGRMVQKLHKVQDVIIRKLENLQVQMDVINNEVKQLALLHSNHQADEHPGLEPNQEYATATESKTNVKLRFLNGLKIPIYTEKNITAESDAAIRIGIFQGDNMITDGPLSKAKVEIVVLRGDFSNDGRVSWTEEEFNNHIVQGRDGQGFVLGGDCSVWLKDGENCLGRIRFKEGSSRTRSRMFVLGARVSKSEYTGVRVQEAIMKPVTVLDRRNEANEKRHPPKLDDEVFRLEEISKDGTYHKRLRKANILTVRDFLKALNKNAEKLREEVLQMKKQMSSWNKMVGHARRCCLKDQHELKAHQSEDGKVTLFFNCVDQLVGAKFSGDYVIYDKFDPAQKTLVNGLKDHAHAKLEGISYHYVMKNNIPEPVYTCSAVAVGPLNPYVHEIPHQDVAENLDHGEVNCVAEEALPPTEEYNPLGPTNFYGSFEHDYTGGNEEGLDVFQHCGVFPQVPTFPYLEDDVAQPSFDEHGQQPSNYAYPGSFHNNCL